MWDLCCLCVVVKIQLYSSVQFSSVQFKPYSFYSIHVTALADGVAWLIARHLAPRRDRCDRRSPLEDIRTRVGGERGEVRRTGVYISTYRLILCTQVTTQAKSREDRRRKRRAVRSRWAIARTQIRHQADDPHRPFHREQRPHRRVGSPSERTAGRSWCPSQLGLAWG